MSSNGLLTFGGSDTSAYPVDFTIDSPPQNRKTIASLWQDWTFFYDNISSGYYLTTGAPGNRRLIIQWNKPQAYDSFSSMDSVTFEAKLFEGSNNAEFHYKDTTVNGDLSVSNGVLSTVGIRDVDGDTTGRNLQWSFQQAVIFDMTAIRIASPVFAVKTVTPQANGSIVLQCSGAPSKPNWIEATTDIKNTAFARLGSSVTADASGNFTFTDTSPGTKKFYRVGFP